MLDGVHPPGWTTSVTWVLGTAGVGAEDPGLRVLPVRLGAGRRRSPSILVRAGGGEGARSIPRVGGCISARLPLAVTLGQELRPYSAALGLVAAFDAARSRHEETGRRRSLVAAVAFGSLACWTLYWAGLFVAFSWGLDLLWRARRRDREGLRRVAVAALLTLLLFLPWLILLGQDTRTERAPSAPKPTVELVLRFAGGLLADRQEDVKQPIVAAVLWVLVLAGIAVGRRGERLRLALELTAFSAGVAITLSLTGHWWALRYLAIALLPASRSIGFVAERVAGSLGTRPAAGLAAAATLVLLQRGAIVDGARWARPDWRRPADYLRFMARSGEGGAVAAADAWAYFALKAQLGRTLPPVKLVLKPTASDLSAWMGETDRGWVVRAPRFDAPEGVGRLLSPDPPWARFPEAEECRVYRVEAGRIVNPQSQGRPRY